MAELIKLCDGFLRNGRGADWMRLFAAILSGYSARLLKKHNGKEVPLLSTDRGCVVGFRWAKDLWYGGFEELGVDRMPKCVLRTEWRLEGDGLTEQRKRLHCKSEESVVTELAMHSGEVFREMLPNLYRRGVYVREDALMAAIDRCDCQEKSRRHMAEYVRLAKKYGEDKAAGKYMKRNGCGRKSFLRMRGRFEKMNLQPVPLRKNFREDVLEPPEACLLQLLKQHK